MIRKILIAMTVCAMAAQSSAFVNSRTRRSADTCGVAKSRTGLIVQGQSFVRGSFPWIVAFLHTEWQPPKFFCAGTIISRSFVISAAHCIHQKHATKSFLPRDILSIFGAHDLSNAYESGRYQLSPKNIFLHDDWNPLTSEYDADISILEFEKESIHFNDFVQPICMWSAESEPSVTDGIVTGWGKSEDPSKRHENEPKMVKAPIHKNEDCFLTGKGLLDLSSKRTFCAGLRNGSGVCTGDSGGGLFIKFKAVYHLRGIVSSSLIKDGGCDVSKNAVYTNVLKFKEWIESVIGVSINLLVPEIVEKVSCLLTMRKTFFSDQLSTCTINEAIDSEEFVLETPVNTTVKQIYIRNEKVEFLPKGIGEKFKNLKELWAEQCGLRILRNFYFKNMRNLEFLDLDENKIKIIEPKAFRSLVNVKNLFLHDNLLETLHEELFTTMVKLDILDLRNNKLAVLSPTTFKIPGGKLRLANLVGNVCDIGRYGPLGYSLDRLESDLRAHCGED